MNSYKTSTMLHRGVHYPKPIMHIAFPPSSAKFINFYPIFVHFAFFLNLHFLLFPILTMIGLHLHIIRALHVGLLDEPDFNACML